MKCNPLRWLWGLFALLPLALLAIVSTRPGIEADLVLRAQETLKRSGYGWAKVVIEGREATVTGLALDEGEPDKAVLAVFETWGVRSSTGTAKLVEKVDKYEWMAERRDGRVRLSGYYPSEKARADILASVKAALPGSQVEDGMKLARGAPAYDVWSGGINFGLKQLAQMKSGQVKLEQTGLTISGDANDQAAFSSLRTALSSSLPKGIQLKQEAIKAPLAKPYTWAAQHGGGQLVLRGFVPSQKDRDAILAAAKSAHPKSRVIDQMRFGEGAPEGYMAAVNAVLAELANLEEGGASLTDAAMAVTGLAETAARADGIRSGLKKVPASIKLAAQIKHREPQIAAVSPYSTSVFAGTGTVVLSGYVPSEDARQSLIAAAKQRFAGRAVVDQLRLGAGQPTEWRKCLDAGIAAVHKLGNGRLLMTDRRLDVSGGTTVADLAQSLPNEVRAAAGADCDADVRVAILQDARPDEARMKAEAEARARADAERLKAEADVRARADAERMRVEQQARAKTDAVRRTQLDGCQNDLRTTARNGINFKRASAEIEPRSFATLNRLAELAARCPDGQIEIEGHTDSEGTPERNRALSERRAQAVLDFLIRAGTDQRRLTAVGYGETRNIAPNDTPENKARNRRIEFTVR